MVSADIFLDGARLENAITFIHVKGYGRARVTHIDIEDKKFNKILPPGTATILRLYGTQTL